MVALNDHERSACHSTPLQSKLGNENTVNVTLLHAYWHTINIIEVFADRTLPLIMLLGNHEHSACHSTPFESNLQMNSIDINIIELRVEC